MSRRAALNSLERSGNVSREDRLVLLTDRGRTQAKELIRTHRLWESYLFEKANVLIDHLHFPAHQLEHVSGPDIREDLQQEMRESERDPHGRPIPGDR